MTDETKNPQQAKIRSGTPKRNPVCYQTTQDIVIPAGTILREIGDRDDYEFACKVGLPDIIGEFCVTVKPGAASSAIRKVIAA